MTKSIPGEFFPLDVHYRRDKAIRRAKAAAELLFIRAGAHAKANSTGGRIEDFDLPALGEGLAEFGGDVYDAVEALVREHLWVVDGDGWMIRSFDKWNPTDPSADGVRGNHTRWHVGRGITSPDCPLCTPDDRGESGAISGAMTPDDRGRIVAESQRREEESREEKRERATKSRRTSLPDGWKPSDTNRAYAAEHGINLEHEADQFRAHHLAKGSKFVKWDQAFRTWLGNAVTYQQRRPPSQQPEQTKLTPAAEYVEPDDDYISGADFYASYAQDDPA